MKKQPVTPSVLEIDSHNHILYILKLHDPGYLDKHISYEKGISLLKMQEKTSNHS